MSQSVMPQCEVVLCRRFADNVWSQIFDKRKIMNTDLNELEKISTDAWIAILKQHPDHAKECSQINAWSRFTHKQWLELLLVQPQFEGKCECFNDFSFSLLQILSDKHPQFKKYMLKARVMKRSVKAWRNLLLKNPKFEQIAWYCPKGIVALLSLKPELAKFYDWNIDFLYAEWTQLLMSRPQFADKCPYLRDFDAFLNWLPLLKRQPCLRGIAERYREGRIAMLAVFTDYVEAYSDWDEIFDYDKYKLIELRPKLIEKFSTLDDIKMFAWEGIIIKNPSLVESAKKCANGLAVLLTINSANKKFVKDWSVFSTHNWAKILSENPKYSKNFESVRKWNELTEEDWFRLLISQPQFAVKCDKFGELNKRKKLLLQEQPILKKYFPELNLFPEKKEMRITRFI